MLEVFIVTTFLKGWPFAQELSSADGDFCCLLWNNLEIKFFLFSLTNYPNDSKSTSKEA